MIYPTCMHSLYLPRDLPLIDGYWKSRTSRNAVKWHESWSPTMRQYSTTHWNHSTLAMQHMRHSDHGLSQTAVQFFFLFFSLIPRSFRFGASAVRYAYSSAYIDILNRQPTWGLPIPNPRTRRTNNLVQAANQDSFTTRRWLRWW